MTRAGRQDVAEQFYSLDGKPDFQPWLDWIARDNPTRAFAFVAELVKSCRSIGKRPPGFPLVDGTRDSRLRRRVHGDYLIFYDVERLQSRSCMYLMVHAIMWRSSFQTRRISQASKRPRHCVRSTAPDR